MSDEGLSCDPILRGRLRLWQPQKGYRFSVDSLLLVDFAATSRGERVCDLCAGVGIVGLALLERAATATLVELQPRLAELARRNAEANQLKARATVLELDLADARAMSAALPGASFDLVVSNPPYQPLGFGPANPDDEAAIARHELRLTLADVVREARRLLVPGGRAAVVYPADRLTALLSALDGEGLKPTRLRPIHPRPGEPARRVLVEAQKGARSPLTIEPPLFVLGDDGAYTAEARRALGED